MGQEINTAVINGMQCARRLSIEYFFNSYDLKNHFHNYLFGLVFIFFTLSSKASAISDTGFVQIQYNGDIDKPIPTIRFFLPGSKYIEQEALSLIQIEINAELLDSIQKIIANGNLNIIMLPVKTITILFFYQLNGTERIIESNNKNAVRKVFEQIIDLNGLKDNKQTIKYALNEIFSRFAFKVGH